MKPEDLYLLCDLFYLPFEHGTRGSKLLNEFNWLKANARVLLDEGKCKNSGGEADTPTKPEVAEWMQRAEYFAKLCNCVQELLRKIALCNNKEICHDLFSYVWDIAGALSLLNAFVKWLRLGHFPPNVFSYTQGSYTCKLNRFVLLNAQIHSVFGSSFRVQQRLERGLYVGRSRTLGLSRWANSRLTASHACGSR